MSEGRQDRHDPTVDEHYLSMQHIERYIFAAAILATGARVLDVASGTGYGARILSDQGFDVIGGDLDESQLFAVSRIMPDTGFVCLDVLNLPFGDDSFDAVVSFETIEHVVEGQRFLAEMYRVLKPGGLFICSTPNIAYTAHPWYHVKEYESAEFYSLVSNKFSKTEKFGQYFRSLDRLEDQMKWFGNKTGLRKLSRICTSLTIATIDRLAQYWKRIAGHVDARQDYAKDNNTPGRNYYSVIPYRGNRLLRIMVTVSQK